MKISMKLIRDKVTSIVDKYKRSVKIIIYVLFALSSYSFQLPMISDITQLPKWQIRFANISSFFGCIFVILMLLLAFGIKRKVGELLFILSPLILIEITNILLFVDSHLFGGKDLILSVVFLWTLFVGFYLGIQALVNKKYANEKTPIALLSFMTILLILGFSNAVLGEWKYAQVFYMLFWGLAYLIAIALYVNRFIYNPKEERKISTIIGIVFWGSLIIISFPYYIKSWGFSAESYSTFISVYNALVGGGITLAGVAWTIKKSEENRKIDLARIEKEKREEEVKKYTPYLKFSDCKDGCCELKVYRTRRGVCDINIPQITDSSKRMSLCGIECFAVKNISLSSLILCGFVFGDNYYEFEYSEIMDKGELCRINSIGTYFECEEKESNMAILVKDVLNNKYLIKCDLNFLAQGTFTSSDGKKEQGYNCQVKSLRLPIPFSEFIDVYDETLGD